MPKNISPIKRLLGFFPWLWYLVLMLPMTVLHSTSVIILSLFVPTKYSGFMRYIARSWGWLAVRGMFLPVRVEGTENIPREGCVIISNHSSLYDIYLGLAFYPVDFLFLAKIETRRIPLVGPAMEKVGYLFIDRKSPKRAHRSLQMVINKIKEGNNVLIYPEGTRSHDAGNMLPFKAGTIKAAKEGRLPILPIVLYGTQTVKPLKTPLYLWPSTLGIRVLPPITPGDELHPANEGDDKARLEKLRQLMMTNYSEMKTKYTAK